jgi:hypothetical protein
MARLGRGGTLKGEGVHVAIKARPFSDRWTIRFAGRQPLRVEPGIRGWVESHPEGSRVVRPSSGAVPLTLRTDEALPVARDSVSVLAFACWLIREWQSMRGGGIDLSGTGPGI